jgi:hypothetical protein
MYVGKGIITEIYKCVQGGPKLLDIRYLTTEICLCMWVKES